MIYQPRTGKKVTKIFWGEKFFLPICGGYVIRDRYLTWKESNKKSFNSGRYFDDDRQGKDYSLYGCKAKGIG